MANNQNLKPLNQRTKSEQRAIQHKGGKASGRARARRKTTRELLNSYDGAPLTDEENAAMDLLGIPQSERTAKLRRVIALIQKAESGDVQANKLILETLGERDLPDTEIDVDVGFVFSIEDGTC